ncbi:zincin-like metallopeptidase domain-containing protein [Escherichia coli]|uniref:zincin-like metallopeptidase domain-containing protein n=1 Tax=Escherichia coli TaxID=562 RepID=UPI0039C865DF
MKSSCRSGFRFADAANFYATGLHELVHWTGAASRLNREKGNKFGSEAYAFEELIAELGSAFLLADLGITGEVQHESYIASSLKALKGDKRYIFKGGGSGLKSAPLADGLLTAGALRCRASEF